MVSNPHFLKCLNSYCPSLWVDNRVKMCRQPTIFPPAVDYLSLSSRWTLLGSLYSRQEEVALLPTTSAIFPTTTKHFDRVGTGSVRRPWVEACHQHAGGLLAGELSCAMKHRLLSPARQ